MGRIAEALKRAQQERAQRLGQTFDPALHGSTVLGPARLSGLAAATGRGQSRAETLGDLARSLLNPPPAPTPFPIIAPPVPSEAVGDEVIAFHDPDSALAEKYRSVRTRLITGNPGGGPRVLALTSTLRGEGKTVTTANIGFSLSELKYLRVAIVDLDFRHGGLSALFGAENEPGLAEVLRGELPLADVCMPVVRDNLYLVPAGNSTGVSASELLASKFVGSLIKELTDRFHYSLIDTPALHDSSDTVSIAPLCHSVVMVVRANSTPEPLLQRCVRLLQANRATVTGCILAGYTEAAIDCETVEQ